MAATNQVCRIEQHPGSHLVSDLTDGANGVRVEVQAAADGDQLWSHRMGKGSQVVDVNRVTVCRYRSRNGVEPVLAG
jgi:hypothetical protein